MVTMINIIPVKQNTKSVGKVMVCMLLVHKQTYMLMLVSSGKSKGADGLPTLHSGGSVQCNSTVLYLYELNLRTGHTNVISHHIQWTFT